MGKALPAELPPWPLYLLTPEDWPPHPVPRPAVSHTLICHAGPGVSCGSGWPQALGKAPFLGSGSASAQGSRKLWAALHRCWVAPTPAHPTQTHLDPGEE